MRWQLPIDKPADLVGMVAGAEVRKNDQFVLKPVGPFDHVVQVHVAELVDLFPPVAWPDEADFGNEDFRLVDRRVSVQTGRAGIARVGQERGSHLASYRRAAQAQVANLLARQALILLLEFEPAVPDNIAQRRNGVYSGKR